MASGGYYSVGVSLKSQTVIALCLRFCLSIQYRAYTMTAATRAFVLLCTFLSFVSAARCGSGRWVDVWGSMPQLVEPANLPNAPWVSHSHALDTS